MQKLKPIFYKRNHAKGLVNAKSRYLAKFQNDKYSNKFVKNVLSTALYVIYNLPFCIVFPSHLLVNNRNVIDKPVVRSRTLPTLIAITCVVLRGMCVFRNRRSAVYQNIICNRRKKMATDVCILKQNITVL